MSWLIYEGLLLLGIIAVMLTIAGNAQYHIHKVAYEHLKHIGNNMWDLTMEKRDKKLIEQPSSASSN
ncbi:hypothetical protein CISIN_1g042797mg [Citrus sinensis]|uniref:NADH dehydrogenase [ubiquinone] 1 alpha subcomplex subunit 1 n=1 Tax=Citrus sinensis TaxID=2711 RepID=A0A067FNU7_CITSI|nr:hypothetical protein CISIN_1g042797mg [Citrus sinensis]